MPTPTDGSNASMCSTSAVPPVAADLGTPNLVTHPPMRNARPAVVHRAVSLRVHPPIGPLAPSAFGVVFDKWRRRCDIDIPCAGAHCLRHSLAMRLRRRDASLQTIGDILDPRSPASPSTYQRLSADDLRVAALDLPIEEAA